MPVTKTSAQRFLRGLLFLGCFAAAILLAGVAALYFLVTPERVSARITEVVERELGLELSMSALPSVRHLPELVVTIPESTLKKPGHDDWQLSLKSAQITLNPLAVFAQSPKIRELRVVKPALAMPEEEFFTRLNEPYLVSTLGFDMDAFVVESGSVTLLSEKPSTASDLSVRLANLSETGAQVFLSGHCERGGFSGAFQLSGVARWPTGLGDLTLEAPIVEFKGLLNGKEWQLRWSAEKLTRENFRAWHMTRPDLRTDVNGRVLSVSANAWDWKEGAWTSREALLSTELSWDGTAMKWRATGNPARDAQGLFHWPDLLLVATHPSGATELTGALSLTRERTGRISLSGTLLGSPAKLDADIARAFSETLDETPRPRLEGSLRLGAQQGALWLALERSGFFSLFDFSGDVSIAGFEHDGALRELSAAVRLLNGELALTEGRGSLYGGAMTFDARKRADGSWNATLQAENVETADFLARSFGRAPVSGKAEVTLRASGHLRHPEEPVDLTAEVSAADATLRGLDLGRAYDLLIEERSDTLPAEVLANDASTPVRAMRFRLAGRPADLLVTDGRMEGEGWRAEFGGSLPPLRPQWLGTFRWEAAGSVPALELPWHFEKPVERNESGWRLSWAQTASAVRNALGEDPWSLESIERRAKRAWLNLRDRIENFEFSAPDFSELKEKFYDWLPFTEKETPAEPTRGGAI